MKRLATDERKDTKRPKVHVKDCVDDQCQGCDVGEIDIELPLDMTALDIYALAKEEVGKSSLSNEIDQSNELVIQKLFEMAISEFEKSKCDLVYCNCLFDFAKFKNVKELMEQARIKLEEFVLGANECQGFLLLGRVYLELASFGYAETDTLEDELTIPPKQILELVKKSIVQLKKAIDISESSNTKLVCAGLLLDHALLQKQYHLLPDHMQETLSIALNWCTRDKSVLLDCKNTGTILFHLASIESYKKIPDLSKALEFANDSVVFLKQVVEGFDDPEASDYQLLGQAYLLVSTLEVDDDDIAIDAFDKGAEALTSALELDPDNENIKQQLNDMGLLAN